MSKETTDNFWQVWNQLKPSVAPPLSYRLYYDDQGHVLFYSMDDHPGNYIEIDADLFSRCPSNIKVINDRIHLLDQYTSTKLRPATTGVPCHPLDVCVIVDQDKEHTKWNKHDEN